MDAIETPKFLKDTAGVPTINGPNKAYFEFTRSLNSKINTLGHGRNNAGVSENKPFVYVLKLLSNDTNTEEEGISKIP